MPNPTAPHTLGPWHGGVDYSKPSEELTKNQLHDMNNTVIGKAGEAAKRLGCAEYNSSAANGTSTLTACGQQRFTAASIREFAISGNKFFEGNSGTFTDRTGSMTISAGDDYTWSLVNARGTLVGHNGKSGDSLIKWSAAGGQFGSVGCRFALFHGQVGRVVRQQSVGRQPVQWHQLGMVQRHQRPGDIWCE